VTLAGGELHDFILLDIPFRMKSAHSLLWGNGHFYHQQNQSVNAKNAQSCRKSVLYDEQKGMLATLSRKTGKPIPTLLTEALAAL
jgi:hypothetical protein